MLCPQSLLFKGNRLQLIDFGLAALLWQPAGLLGSQLQPRYVAEEVLQTGGSSRSDQFSLAVIYQEMLTGDPPFCCRPACRAPLPGGEPNLNSLPPADQPILARALNPDPHKRFASCTELIDALEQAGAGRLFGTSSRVLARRPRASWPS